MVRIILLWCGRWDLNPHTEVPAPKTGASAIPPLPRIGCRASYSARQRSYSSMEIPGLSNRTREYLSLWMILAPKTVGREQDSRLARRIGQSALKPDGIRFTHRSVCGKLNRGTERESARCHNDLTFVSGHVPRFRGGCGIDRRTRLNSAAESDQSLGGAQRNRLNDVVAHLCRCRIGFKPHLFKQSGGKNSCF